MSGEADPATPEAGSTAAEMITAIAALIEALAWPLLIVATLLAVAFSTALRRHATNAIKLLGSILKKGGEVSVGPIAIKGVPPAIADDSVKVTTKEGTDGAGLRDVTPEVIRAFSQDTAPMGLATYPYLLHSAVVQVPRTAPMNGRYSVRVWVEFDKNFGFSPDEVKLVVYRLDGSWANNRRVITTAAAESQFELWISVYGEFTIIAAVEKTDGTQVILSRYLDLPGRPPD